MPRVDGRLTFEVKGRTARDIARHLSRGAGTASLMTFASSPMGLAMAALVVVGAVSGLRQSAAPADVIMAHRILVFEDYSGSMANVAGSLPATEKWMQEELAPLTAYGVEQRLIRVNGFGVLHDQSSNFLHALENAASGSDADAVYLFSDFNPQTHAIDDDDDQGFEELRAFLRAHHLRLYLRTVLKQPAARLLAIAHESGGDFIGEP